ncbi:MAG: hypothetical protein HOI47_29655 [Candidatus Scalindua sp.]|jgi:DNA-binding MarR family transcriptional regulator|nr:hypothetical protein [Candidatus Scalindua sp.]
MGRFIEKDALQNCWVGLANGKFHKNMIMLEDGIKLSDSSFEILCSIAYKPVSRSELMRCRYFSDISLSTIKRAVTELLKSGIVVVVVDKNDRRRKILTLVNKT